MPLFEVFIPATDPEGFNITARIDAESWIQALRNGIAKLGVSANIQNIMVDITTDAIEVTEPESGRVFRIKEIGASAAAAPPAAARPVAAPPAAARPVAAPPAAARPVAAPPTAARPVAAPPAAARPVAAPPVVAPPVVARPVVAPPVVAPPVVARPVVARPTAAPPAAALPAAAALAVPRVAAPPVAVAHPAAAATGPTPVRAVGRRFTGDVGADLGVEKTTGSDHGLVGRGKTLEVRPVEDILGELFESTQDIHEQPDVSAAARFILGLAMRSVPCESGAVFLAEISNSVLSFAAAAGPKAKDVMGFKVPIGKGIVGFCAQEGISMAISDVHRNPHFFAAISKKLGYETRSILCSPAQVQGRVYGALQLINKNGGATFSNDEVNVLNFLAHEFADYLVNSGHST